MTNSTDPTLKDALQILDEHYGKQYGDVVRKNLKPSKKKKKIGTVTFTKPKGWVRPKPSFLSSYHAHREWLTKLVDEMPEGSSITRQYVLDMERRSVEWEARRAGLKVSRVKFSYE